MKREPGEHVISPFFEMADKSKWILQIFIGGKTQRQAGYITTEVTLTDLGDTGRDCIAATVKLSVLSQKITTVQDPDVESTSFQSIAGSNFTLDDPASKTWAVDNFMQTAALERQYLLNDAVLFSIDIEILGKPIPLNGTMSAYVGSAVTIQEDLASLLYTTDEISGDIILVTPDEKRFPCHKCILASRSRAFKRKFMNPTFTPKLIINRGQYFIRNVSSTTFKDVLHFIYTDECR
jgi:BTB/POZ domain